MNESSITTRVIIVLMLCLCSHVSYVSSFHLPSLPVPMNSIISTCTGIRKKLSIITIATAVSLTSSSSIAHARPEGVNRPDLLPTEQTTVIDVANYLSKGEEKKARVSIDELEKNTGYKLRVLLQSYPNTPGLAIKDYWDVDDNTIILVVDRGEGFNRKGIPTNIMNLNIGKNVNDVLPSMFWARLTNKLGNVNICIRIYLQ